MIFVRSHMGRNMASAKNPTTRARPLIDSILVRTDVGADFAVTSATSTDALIFTVSKVQEVTITNVVGTWTLPTT